ncbi:MAG TPA: helix-turn-helix transcriptional regulator [Dehalococcoidia bacterium]|nr:helix-turn-helix transcriptional regulator [Dehalococcoidia bacterium]
MNLTRRERQILVQLVQGRTNEEIAEQLGIKTSTVKTLMSPLMQKTGKRNRTELAVWACLGFSPSADIAELLVANIPQFDTPQP